MTRTRQHWAIRRRDGLFLYQAEQVPFEWNDRAALIFRSKKAATSMLASVWGVHVAREFGLRAERID